MMNGYCFPFPASVVAFKGYIEPEDVLLMRTYAFPDGITTTMDADVLLALNRACPESCPDWQHYFVESLAAFLLYEVHPAGSLDEAKGTWLIGALAVDGVVQTATELELLLHTMELSTDVSEQLSVLALSQLRDALRGDRAGAYATARPPGDTVTAADVAYLWRILRRAVDHGRLVLSLREAEILLEIDRLASQSHVHPGWRDVMEQIVIAGHGSVAKPEGSLPPELDWAMQDENRAA